MSSDYVLALRVFESLGGLDFYKSAWLDFWYEKDIITRRRKGRYASKLYDQLSDRDKLEVAAWWAGIVRTIPQEEFDFHLKNLVTSFGIEIDDAAG